MFSGNRDTIVRPRRTHSAAVRAASNDIDTTRPQHVTAALVITLHNLQHHGTRPEAFHP